MLQKRLQRMVFICFKRMVGRKLRGMRIDRAKITYLSCFLFASALLWFPAAHVACCSNALEGETIRACLKTFQSHDVAIDGEVLIFKIMQQNWTAKTQPRTDIKTIPTSGISDTEDTCGPVELVTWGSPLLSAVVVWGTRSGIDSSSLSDSVAESSARCINLSGSCKHLQFQSPVILRNPAVTLRTH